MTAGKYFSKYIFQCKCVLFFTFIFLTVSQKKCLGEWTLWQLLYFAKIQWLYVRTIGVCGYGYIHGYPWICPWISTENLWIWIWI